MWNTWWLQSFNDRLFGFTWEQVFANSFATCNAANGHWIVTSRKDSLCFKVMQVSVSSCIHIALGVFSTLINIIGNFSINNWKMLNVHLSFWTPTFAQKYFLIQLMLGAWIEFFRNLISRRNILSFFYSYVQNGFARLFTCWLQKT